MMYMKHLADEVFNRMNSLDEVVDFTPFAQVFLHW